MCKLKIILILATILPLSNFGQDTNVVWLRHIDTTSFKISYSKKIIPQDFYNYIGIKDLKGIANPNEECNLGCVSRKGVPNRQFNWAATDQKNHYIISVTTGGYMHRTMYYFLDRDSKKLNVNILNFEHGSRNYTLEKAVTAIKNRDFEFVE